MSEMYNIVGQYFAGAQDLQAELPTPHALVLYREPDNPHDDNAVQVWTEWDDQLERLGYIARDQAAELGPELDRRGLEVCPAIHFHGLCSIPLWPTWRVPSTEREFETQDEVRQQAADEEVLDPNEHINHFINLAMEAYNHEPDD